MMDENDMPSYNDQTATERWALPQVFPRLYLNQVDTLLQAFSDFQTFLQVSEIKSF